MATQMVPIMQLRPNIPPHSAKFIQENYGTSSFPMWNWVHMVQTGEREFDPESEEDQDRLDEYNQLVAKYGQPPGMSPMQQFVSDVGAPVAGMVAQNIYKAFQDPALSDATIPDKIMAGTKSSFGMGDLPSKSLYDARKQALVDIKKASMPIPETHVVLDKLANQDIADKYGYGDLFRKLAEPEVIVDKSGIAKGFGFRNKGIYKIGKTTDPTKTLMGFGPEDPGRLQTYVWPIKTLKQFGGELSKDGKWTFTERQVAPWKDASDYGLQTISEDSDMGFFGYDEPYPSDEFQVQPSPVGDQGEFYSELDPGVELSSPDLTGSFLGDQGEFYSELDPGFELSPQYRSGLELTWVPQPYDPVINEQVGGAREAFRDVLTSPSTVGDSAAEVVTPDITTGPDFTGRLQSAGVNAAANFGVQLLAGKDPLKAAVSSGASAIGSMVGNYMLPGIGGFIGGALGGMLGGRVICNELHRQGFLERRQVILDYKFTREHLTPKHVKGYHVWATHVVRKLREGKQISLWRHMAIHRAREIEYIYGERDKPDYLGKIYRHVGEPICWVLGNFCKETDWSVLYQPKEI